MFTTREKGGEDLTKTDSGVVQTKQVRFQECYFPGLKNVHWDTSDIVQEYKTYSMTKSIETTVNESERANKRPLQSDISDNMQHINDLIA